LIQFDDLDAAAVEPITPHAFMALCGSPANFQAYRRGERAYGHLHAKCFCGRPCNCPFGRFSFILRRQDHRQLRPL